jgi:hypothetical protein
MTQLHTDTTPARKDGTLIARDDGVKYMFRIVVGGTAFASSWYFGDDDRIEEHREQVRQAFRQADGIEVVK